MPNHVSRHVVWLILAVLVAGCATAAPPPPPPKVDNRLYIAEASAPVGTHDALQFEQSITILDPMGNDLDNGQGSPACP